MTERSRPTVALVVVAVSLGAALLPSMPYGYYSIMRWIVCAACAWLAFAAHEDGREGWTWVWVVLAGIYNPIVRVHATRELWTVVNLATLAVLATYAYVGRKPPTAPPG